MADACPNCGVWLGNEPLPNDSAWERLRAEIVRLRAAGDRLAAAINAVACSGPWDAMVELTAAYIDWEARRG